MVKKMLRENMEIEVERYHSCYGRYKARILQLKDEELLITEPQRAGEAMELSPGQTIVVKYSGQLGKYYFFSQVKGSGDWACKFYMLDYPEKVYRIQRRENVRISIDNRVIYQTETDCMAKGLGQNLSAGGIRLLGFVPVETGKEVDVYLDFLFQDPIKGQVVRCEKQEEKWDISIRFMNLDNSKKEDIIRWLFVRQRQTSED